MSLETDPCAPGSRAVSLSMEHCLNNLATLRTGHATDPGVWWCIECHARFQMWEVVEALRERAVARDKVYRQSPSLKAKEKAHVRS